LNSACAWFEDPHRKVVFAFERDHALAQVIADESQGFPNIPSLWEVTAPVSVVRLHGRNAENWDAKGLPSVSERFNYLYSDDEMTELAEHVRGLVAATGQVHVVFNNNFGDCAQRNARQLRGLLEA
jgi:uncharacterized protein YecE (DUF72 family)